METTHEFRSTSLKKEACQMIRLCVLVQLLAKREARTSKGRKT